jgi:hypothetical protein
MRRAIIGIDCAVDPRRVGLALGWPDGEGLQIAEVATGSRDRPPLATILDWLPEESPTLLALDAPLGWPASLGEALSGHQAGEAIGEHPNALFRRETDRFVKQRIGKQPLDVGADRIARTAHAALDLLRQLREETGTAIPLAWDPNDEHRLSAVEVYPAATLTVYGIQATGYKRKDQTAARAALVEELERHLTLPEDRAILAGNPDVVDAVVCVLAGRDFLSGHTLRPADMGLARKEGWIWVRERD